MDLKKDLELTLTRRQLFGRASAGIGIAALASLLDPGLFAAAGSEANRDAKTGGLLGPVFLLTPIALLALRRPPGRRLLLAALILLY